MSPLDFFGFGYLKGRLAKRRVKTLRGLKSAAKQEWALRSDELVQRVFKAWQYRLKLLVEKHGNHIENVEKLHNEHVSQY